MKEVKMTTKARRELLEVLKEKQISDICFEDLLMIIGIFPIRIQFSSDNNSKLIVKSENTYYTMDLKYSTDMPFPQIIVEHHNCISTYDIVEEEVPDYDKSCITTNSRVLRYSNVIQKLCNEAITVFDKFVVRIKADENLDFLSEAPTAPCQYPKLVKKEVIISDKCKLEFQYNGLSSQISLLENEKNYMLKIDFTFNVYTAILELKKLSCDIEKELISIFTDYSWDDVKAELMYLENNTSYFLTEIHSINVLSNELYRQLGNLYMPILEDTKNIENFKISFSCNKEDKDITLAFLNYSKEVGFSEASICY